MEPPSQTTRKEAGYVATGESWIPGCVGSLCALQSLGGHDSDSWWVWDERRDRGVVGVMANLSCQLDWLWKQLEPKLLGAPPGDFS